MANSNELEQRRLVSRRATFKSQLTRFKTLVENQSHTPNLPLLKVRTTAIQEVFTKFDEVQVHLEFLDENQLEERARFEDEYYETLVKALAILKEGHTDISDNTTTQSGENQNSHRNVEVTDIDICLPKINLPTFNGLYEDWPGFYDQFKSIVNDNTRINDYKKLMYLRSCLTGEAAKIIQSLGNSSANYSVAWSLLRKRYDDPAIVVSNHTKALFDIQPPRKASHRELPQFLSTTEAHYRALRALEQPTTEILRDCTDNVHLRLDSSNVTKTLGVSWNPTQDALFSTVQNDDSSLRTTKRTILSQIAQLFDPLGLLGPVIVKAKLIMQCLWQLKTDWDESLPQDIHMAWRNYREELSLLQITIPRKIISDNHIDIQLHGFCDASEQAYGACIYLRSTDIHGNISTSLVSSRSRVAPLKSVSLPRLELCAAVLLSKLFKATSQSLNITFSNVYFWSDSTITLHWIHTQPHSLKTFVANRVPEIQAITSPHNWSHISSQDNPADFISRGQMPHEFVSNIHWLQGPAWLANPEESWPKFEIHLKQLPEQRPIIVLPIVTTEFSFLNKFSSLITLKRVVAYCFRFYNNIKNNKDRRTGCLTTKELQDATTVIIKCVQREAFPNETRALSQRKSLDVKSKLFSLNPFVDANGIIGVGGRLEHSEMPYSRKHQILLPHNHHITTLIIRNEHLENYHSAAQATLHAVRQYYWPINERKIVKAVLHKCITCRRANPLTPTYVMGQLPKDRVTFNRPFLNAGVDFCGPMYIKEKKYRNRGKVKMRGKCANLYSDNATNFVGARHEHEEIHKLRKESNERVHKHLADENINWHFIPPRSPHFGGLWEASVKSFKNHLHRVIGDKLLSYEELFTYVTEIEAILDSRPLIPLSSDPNDLAALTPGHFLIGDSLTSIPEHDLTDVPSTRLSSWQLVQQMKQHFWQRWYKEYLNELTVRKKWHSGATDDITIGSLVTIKEDHLPPLRWLLGRVVTVKTASGEYKRSVKKLSPLPIEVEVN